MTHGFPVTFGVSYSSKPEGPGIIAQFRNPRGSWGHDSIPEGQIKLAKRFTEECTSEAWKNDVERKAKAALGKDDYQRSRSRSTLRMCKQLANEAEFLLNLTQQAEQAIEDALYPALEWIKPPALQKIIARKFAKRITAVTGADTLTAIARALRCYGIFLCTVDDHVDLIDCHCLRPLARSEITAKIKEEVKAVVKRGFEPLAFRPGEDAT